MKQGGDKIETKTKKGGDRPEWIFVVLPDAEILACMNELGIPMVLADLERPTPGKLQLIYSAFLDILMGLTKEYFEAPVEACEGEVDHFDIYADTLLLMNVYRDLQGLMREVGYTPFSLQDLVKPEGNRVRLILSAIINFAKFREEQLEVYDKFANKSKIIQDKHDELLEQNERLIRQVEDLKIRRIKEEPLVAEARATNDGLKNELFDLKIRQSATAADYDKLKTEKQELTSRLDNYALLQQTTEREMQKIRSRIVHSPEKLKQQLSDMSSSLSNEKSSLTVKSKKTRELNAKVEILTTLESDVQGCIKLMEECDAGLERVDAAHNRLIHLQDALDTASFEIVDIKSKDEQLQRQLDNAMERLSRASKQLESKREAARARMDRIEQERRIVQTERAQIESEMDQKKAMIDAMQNKTAQLRAEVASEVENINAEFRALTGHVDLYMKEVQMTMNQTAIAV